jgi:dimethylargininase
VTGPRIALVRPPGPRLVEGLVTHIARTPVDVDQARAQHAGYVEALRAAGWAVHEVPPADDCPDAVFIEDAVVIINDMADGLAIVTRPGAPSRWPEIAGAEAAVRELGLAVTRVEPPATLDGGDVLQIGTTIYVGVGGRTNSAGVDQLRALVAPRGRRVVPVPLGQVLHLKSAVTALPDGTCLAVPGAVDTSVFGRVRLVDEEAGAHVVPLGGDQVLIAASAPRTAGELADAGFTPVVVDIGEFEKLEGCVTCLSVLVG